MNEFRALLELLGMLISDPRTGTLLALLALAAWHDSRTFRIPNFLTGGGVVFAVIYNVLVPPVAHAGWFWAPAGMLLGLALMLPMYALRVMGAGDAKLMAMVGAFVGVGGVLHAVLFSIVTAGIAALFFAAGHGVMLRMLGNVRQLMRGLVWSAVAGGRPTLPTGAIEPVGRLPYGVSIALGTGAWLVADQLGFV